MSCFTLTLARIMCLTETKGMGVDALLMSSRCRRLSEVKYCLTSSKLDVLADEIHFRAPIVYVFLSL